MEIIDKLLGKGTDFFQFLGFGVFVCFIIYLICQTISFNYKFVEGMVSSRNSDEVADIIKSGEDGGRVGLDHDKIIQRLGKNRDLLNKMLQLPQDTGKLREQLEDFKDNIVLEELLLLNQASCRDCEPSKMVTIGHKLKAYKHIADAIDRVGLEKDNGWL